MPASCTRKQNLPKESGLLKGKYISAGQIIYSWWDWPRGGAVTNMFATKEEGLRIKEVQLDWGNNKGGEEQKVHNDVNNKKIF